ncbi:MAG: hypothetical protein LBI87_15440 [Candidatus Accumulibacter sp.]|nr:hypothetical protein [Accumulibacter sp.]
MPSINCVRISCARAWMRRENLARLTASAESRAATPGGIGRPGVRRRVRRG